MTTLSRRSVYIDLYSHYIVSCTDIGRHITKQLKVYLFYAQQTQVLQS